MPLLPSPFNVGLSGAVEEAELEAPERQTAALGVVIAPFPVLCAMQRWLQEAAMLEWTFASISTVQARIVVRTHGREGGMPLDAPGHIVAQGTLAAGSSLWWRVDGRVCEMGVSGCEEALRAEHGLSRGAWEAGAVVNLHVPAMPGAYVLKVKELRA